jgi:hypothetical protein
MPPPYRIDPDHFLDLSGAVETTREDVRAAWHRAYALLEQRLAEFGCTATLNAPFEVAAAQNARRSGLARIREEAIRHVYENLEPPSLEDGFHELIEVSSARTGA